MVSHRRDPYLWLCLASVAIVPLCLDVCLAGLAVGEPIVPPWLELVTLVAIGTLPILWLQLQRPFYVFSVPGLALRPDQLSEQRRRLLTLQRGWFSRGLVLLTAIALGYLLYGLYQMAPLVTDLPWLTGKPRTTGWGVCAIAFFGANFFTLVPVTVVPLLLTSPQRLEQVSPFESTNILQQFTVLGLRVGKILPEARPAEVRLEEAAATASGAHGVETDPPERLVSPSGAGAEAVFTAINEAVATVDDRVEMEAEGTALGDGAVSEPATDDVVAVTMSVKAAGEHGSEIDSQGQEPTLSIAVSESEANLGMLGDVSLEDEGSEATTPPVMSEATTQRTETLADSDADAVTTTLQNQPVSSDPRETVNNEEIVILPDTPAAVHQERPVDTSNLINSLDELVVEVKEGTTSEAL